MRARIEELAEARVDEVAALSARCFERPWTVDELETERVRPVGRVLIALENDVAKGYAVAHAVADEVEILTIGVDPTSRRCGIGRALLHALLEGATRAFLEVRRSNDAARALYRRGGFIVSGVRKEYYRDGEDALVMGWSRAATEAP